MKHIKFWLAFSMEANSVLLREDVENRLLGSQLLPRVEGKPAAAWRGKRSNPPFDLPVAFAFALCLSFCPTLLTFVFAPSYIQELPECPTNNQQKWPIWKLPRWRWPAHNRRPSSGEVPSTIRLSWWQVPSTKIQAEIKSNSGYSWLAPIPCPMWTLTIVDRIHTSLPIEVKSME